jgi:hypothetical protein
MAATLLAHLGLEMNRRHARLDERLHRSGDIKRPAPAGIDIDERRQRGASVMRRTSIRTSSIVLMPRSGTPSEFAAIADE